MEKFNTYLNIKQMREVVIGEDYPYTNLPELPLCEKLIVRNGNIKTIESQPNCKYVDIISCLPHQKGQLFQIGDLPQCTSLSVFAAKLKLIGKTNCKNLKLINLHNRKPLIDPEASTIIKNSDLDILYIDTTGRTTKEVIEDMLEQGLPMKDIDFSQSKTYESDHSHCIELKNIDFSHGIIENVNFENCDLRGASFDGTKLQNVIFDSCMFDQTNFHQVDFSSCTVRYCRFEKANLSQATITPDMVINLDKSNVQGTTVAIDEGKLELKQWQERNEHMEMYPEVDASTSVIIYDLKGYVYFVGSGNMTFKDTIQKLLAEKKEIIGIDFDNVTYNGNLELSDINFSGHTIENARICDCRFDFVSFINTKLNNVIFQRCDFKSVDFSDLDLCNVYFSECQFSEYTLLQNSIISPQLACLWADEKQLPSLVKVQVQDADPIPLEQFVSSIPENKFDTLWNSYNLYLLLNLSETEICFAGKEKDCYEQLDFLPKDQYSVKKCDTFLHKRIHSSIGDYCKQILSHQNYSCNEDYNLANHLDVILTDIMQEALTFDYLSVLQECSDFINSFHKENHLFYQSHCFLENNKTTINLKMHIANQSQIPQSPTPEKKMGI